jgi:hypothetical protein
MKRSFIFCMSRNQLNINELKVFVEKLKLELRADNIYVSYDPKRYADKYLNRVLDKLSEYRY